MGEKKKCIVIGIGNKLRSDDGAGVAAVAQLAKRKLPPDIGIIEGGTDIFGLIEQLQEADHAVIIDAISAGKPPGTISIFAAEDAKLLSDSGSAYLHGFSVAEMMTLARTMGISPEIIFLGIEPLSTELGENLTPLVASRVPVLVKTALELTEQGWKNKFRNQSPQNAGM